MMNERYAQLTQPSEFLDDVPVELAAVNKDLLPGTSGDKDWVHISERLWQRLLTIGAAYNLHFSQVVEPVIETVLGPEQCESFDSELDFLAGVVNDPAFSEALLIVRAEVGKVINRKCMRLVISPP